MKPVIVAGREYSLTHLTARSIHCPCDKIGRPILIYVHFTPHCYTKSFDPDQHDGSEILCSDSPERHRVFCPIRYELSPRLPDLIDNIVTARVHQTSVQRNYVYVIPLDIGDQVYEIYFMLQRAAAEDGADLRLTVESAYSVDTPTPRKKRPNEIRFKVLALKVLQNMPIRFAPR